MAFSCNKHEYDQNQKNKDSDSTDYYQLMDQKFVEELLNKNSLIIGPRESGKSNLIFNILKILDPHFENIIYVNDFIDLNSFSEIYLNTIKDKNEKTLIIIEDINKYKNINDDFKELLYNSRHYNTTLILTCQTVSLTSQLICNMDHFIINKNLNHSEIQRLWSKMGNFISNTFEEFKYKITFGINNKYQFCYLNKNKFYSNIVCKYINLHYENCKVNLYNEIFKKMSESKEIYELSSESQKEVKLLLSQIRLFCDRIEKLIKI